MKLAHFIVVGALILLTSGVGAASGVKRFVVEEATIAEVQAAYRL